MISEWRDLPSAELIREFPGLDPGPEESLESFEAVEREGQLAYIREQHSTKGQTWFTVRMDREGTHIEMDSMFDQSTTLDIALSLTPVQAARTESSP